MKSIWREKEVGMRVKKGLYESIVVPTVMYGGESWGLRKKENNGLNVMEINCLRNMCRVSCREHVHNKEARRRMEVEVSWRKGWKREC